MPALLGRFFTPAAFWAAWFATVVFLYPIPGTVALRNLLLACGIAGWFWLPGAGRPPRIAQLRAPALVLAVLTLWIVVQAATVSAWPAIAFGNMRGDWLVPMLTALLAAWCAARLPPGTALRCAALGLLLHLVWVLGYQALKWQAVGTWPLGAVPFAERDYQSSISGFLIALAFADRTAYLVARSSPFGLAPALGWGLAVLALGTDVLVKTRNGTVVTIVLLLAVIAAFIACRAGPLRRRLAVGAAAVATVAVIGVTSWTSDARWGRLIESAQLGWTSPAIVFRPDRVDVLLPDGQGVEDSALVRSALAHLALAAIAEHPLGVGFARDAFGHTVPPQYGEPNMGGSSHSGGLDFTLATGLPGMALLLLTAGLAMRAGWRKFRADDDGAALMFSFLVGGYLLRCLLDGHLSGWRLGLFSFLTGILLASMQGARRAP